MPIRHSSPPRAPRSGLKASASTEVGRARSDSPTPWRARERLLARSLAGLLGMVAFTAGGAPHDARAATVQQAAPAWLGVVLSDTDAGASVDRTFPGSPAAQSLLPGDVIEAVGGARARDRATVVTLVAARHAGEPVDLELVRDGARLTVTVTLATRPGVGGFARLFVGEDFPAPALTDIDGAPVALRGHRIMVVDFWATWCLPCLAATPTLEAMHRDLAGAGLAIVAVSEDDERTLRRYQDRARLPWALVSDPSAQLQSELLVEAIPTWFVVDADGTVLGVYSGVDGVDALDADVRRRLAVAAE